MKIKLSIKNRFTGSVLFEYEKEDNTMRQTVEEAIRSYADLSSADLSYADLSYANLRSADLSYANLSSADLSYTNLRYADLRYANLRYADLSYANLSSADLSYANLSSANLSYTNLSYADLSYANLSSADLRYADLSYTNLRYADLRSADLRYANLRSIKNDFWDVLLHSIVEIPFLKQNIIEGKIDGSTYDGECACLSGTLVNGAKFHNGPQEPVIIKSIMSCRDSGRPIERFFLGIKKGDTPETNQVSKIVLGWLEEFESYLINACIPI